MTKDQVRVGLNLRVTSDRWDAQTGTIARVEYVRQACGLEDWCEWLNRVDPRFRHRQTNLNLFDQDLQDFELYTGPIEPLNRNPGPRRVMILETTVGFSMLMRL